MQTEIYRNTEACERAGNNVHARRKELCEELGLTAQAELKNNSLGEAKEYYPLLSRDEAIVWQRFLPNAYSMNHEGHWAGYKFDCIPVETLDEIQFARKLGVFTNLVIRTTERAADPAVFGNVGQTGDFLICRWGEALKPFEEIKRQVLNGLVNFWNWGEKPKSFGDLPDAIQKHVLQTCTTRWTMDTPLNGLGCTGIGGRSRIFHRHCGKPMRRVADLFVCEKCGKTQPSFP